MHCYEGYDLKMKNLFYIVKEYKNFSFIIVYFIRFSSYKLNNNETIDEIKLDIHNLMLSTDNCFQGCGIKRYAYINNKKFISRNFM